MGERSWAVRCVVAILLASAPALTGCTDAHLGTETGNPPLIDHMKLRLERGDEDGTVRVVGAAGAVPGGTEVEVTNVVTGAAVRVEASADGAFEATLTGSLQDTYLVTALVDGVRAPLGVVLGGGEPAQVTPTETTDGGTVPVDASDAESPTDEPLVRFSARVRLGDSLSGIGNAGIVEDLDGDGIDELALVRKDAGVTIHYGSGAVGRGALDEAEALSFCDATWIPEAGDFNGDGEVDMLVLAAPGDCGAANASGEVAEYIVYGTGTPLRGDHRVQDLGVPVAFDDLYPTLRNVGDVDCDGADDLASWSHVMMDAQGFVATVWSGAGIGETAELNAVAMRLSVPGLASYGVTLTPAGDLDGDGCADVAVASQSDIHVFYGRPARAQTLVPTSDDVIVVENWPAGDVVNSDAQYGDFDGDGYADILAKRYALDSSDASFQLVVYRGGAERNSAPLSAREPDVVRDVGGPDFDFNDDNIIAKGDFDGDGLTDVPVRVFLPTQNATPHAMLSGRSLTVEGELSSWRYLELGDIEPLADGYEPDGDFLFHGRAGDVSGDGRDDLLITHGQAQELDVGVANIYELVLGGGG